MSITERSKEPEPTREKVAAEYRDHAAIRVCDDELWELNVGQNAVQSGRQAGRDRIAPVRRRSQWRPDPSAVEEAHRQFERERDDKAIRLARMGRIVIHSTGAGWTAVRLRFLVRPADSELNPVCYVPAPLERCLHRKQRAP